MPAPGAYVCLAVGVVLLMASDASPQQVPQTSGPAATDLHTQPVTAPERRWHNDWFRDRPYFDPVVAEPRAPQIAFTFPAWAKETEFAVEPGSRLVWDITVGREIPVFTRANFDEATLRAGSQGFGYWFDLSFHMMEDMGKDPSNPIINTDYRFSLGKIKYYRVLSVSSDTVPRRWKSMAFRWDIYHHESTHLGDEYVIQGQAVHPEFERINVSYEFYDITGAFNWEGGDGLLHSIRGGTTGLVKPSHGYYSDHTLQFPEEDQRAVIKTERNFEPYIQYQFHAPFRSRISADPFAKPGAPAPSGGTAAGPAPQPDSAFERPARWAFFGSADLRRRIVFDYHKLSEDIKEDTQWSFNLLAGIRSQPGNFRFSIKEIYARVYRGVNPNGQLRNQKDFWIVGLGVNFAVGDR